jgi:serine/threonine-protein kinase 24/25/MST4
MAKKTNYLTELIERHERWKAEGGEKYEENGPDPEVDLYVHNVYCCIPNLLSFGSQESENPEDLWDFGTIRHGGRPNTIGRAHHSIRAPTGPPLTWENNDTAPRYDGPPLAPQQRIPDPTYSSPATERGDRNLPPIPPLSANSSDFHQSTVRHMQPVENNRSTHGVPVQQAPSENYDDYDDQYADTYSSTKSSVVQQKMREIQLEDDLPDTTMLDSVVLPAIASVSSIYPM